MSIKQLLKSIWLYSWVLIVPLAFLASFMDLLLLGGIRLFLAIISDTWKFVSFDFSWLKNINTMPHWIVIMFSIIAIRYLLITIRVRSEERLSHKLESYLQVWWIRKVEKLHPSQFHKSETKGILHNSNLSVSALSKGCKVVTNSIQAISQLLFFVPVLFWISWQLTTLLIFIFLPLIIYLQSSIKKADKGIDDYSRVSGDYSSDLWRWAALSQFWNNRAELSKYLSLILNEIRNLRNTSIKTSVKDITIMQNTETFYTIIMCIILAACTGLIKMGAMEPFQIILFCAALFICYKPIKDCSLLYYSLRDIRKAYTGLSQLEKMEHSVKFIKEKEEDCIRIENMSFKYKKTEPWVFNDLSNIIRLNRPMILEGENGSGKTTLLRILSSLEIPQNGKIYMPRRYREGSFYFSQRLFLPPISWLEQEIKEKQWSETIQKLFEALELQNLFKKSGHSNGELQKIGLAWAIASGRPFLFLDEPFAFIAKDLREPIFKAFWNATTETDQWWMMSSHETLPTAYNDRVVHWKLGGS